MSGKIRAGLLPLYLLMHDEVFPERRAEAQAYLDQVIRWLTGLGVEVTAAPVCRLRPEFEAAAELLNGADLDAVVTLHLVYSPSLESIDAIRSLSAPLVVLDTTPDNDFGERPSPRGIRPNIGIHGVQDLCSLLTRFCVPFAIAAGHLSDPRVGERLLTALLAARAAKCLRTARVGRIGGAYPGMGDFTVSDQRLSEELGVRVVDFAPGDARPPVGDGDPALQSELMEDRRDFELCCEQDADYLAAARSGLAVRRWIGREKLTAFSANFMGTGPAGLPRMPFLEASKAMARGVGYAGEGDVLTAALLGALLTACPDSSFVEMFCPGWSDNTLFLSHMGELNPSLTAGRPRVIRKPMPYAGDGDTVSLTGRYRAGEAVLVNLTPLHKGFRLILSPVELLDREDGLSDFVSGWLRPSLPLPEFLEAFSLMGGTHHSVLCYGAKLDSLRLFGRLAGLETRVIGEIGGTEYGG